MVKVYAHASHSYTHFTDRGAVEYRWPANGWRDVPDEVARIVTEGAPAKLVILKPGETEPGEPEPVVEVVEPETTAEPPNKWFRSVKKGR